jgi:His/Glu/Gln/Arg/opine family amino acid ABC transporter permease subunit
MDYALIMSSLPEMFDGLLITLQLLLCTLAVGLIISVPMALCWTEGPTPVKWLIHFYVTLFRGTPLLVQIFLIYYGLGQFEAVRDSALWPFFRDPFYCALLALSLNTSAYTTNIIRGAIKAVPYGEIEAGRAFAMSRLTLYRYVILPQAFKMVLPAYGNEIIIILKATSLASTVTIMDLTGVAYNIFSTTYQPYEPFITAALIYIFITFTLTRLFRLVEVRLNRQTVDW